MRLWNVSSLYVCACEIKFQYWIVIHTWELGGIEVRIQSVLLDKVFFCYCLLIVEGFIFLLWFIFYGRVYIFAIVYILRKGLYFCYCLYFAEGFIFLLLFIFCGRVYIFAIVYIFKKSEGFIFLLLFICCGRVYIFAIVYIFKKSFF